MKQAFISHLFHKNIIAGAGSNDTPSILFTLRKRFGINITSGAQFLDLDSLKATEAEMGYEIEEPFYRGFPQTVKSLTTEMKLFDQAIHYLNTYGFDNFNDPGHSIIEDNFYRLSFNERARVRNFKCVSYQEASDIIINDTLSLLKNSRNLNDDDFTFILESILEYKLEPKYIKSKDTIIKLYLKTLDPYYAKLLKLSDVITVLSYLSYSRYNNENLKKLNLKNKDRKLLSKLIDELFKLGNENIEDCFSKKRIWAGLLHHIHYKPKCKEAENFIKLIRGRKNLSYYSSMINLIENHKINEAIIFIKANLGNGIYTRSLSYLLSRSQTDLEKNSIINNIDTNNLILIIQLIMAYSNNPNQKRYFTFNKFNKLALHIESDNEYKKRGTILDSSTINLALKRLKAILLSKLNGKIKTLYIDKNLPTLAIPYDEANSSNGIGLLPTGSKIKIPKSKIIRLFTYWEKVPDIDLSLIMLNNDNSTLEFSWRTNALLKTDSILFSGDQTSGIKGGSEYYDLNLKKIKKEYPKAQYLIAVDNVFSGMLFKDCLAYAGYMQRSKINSGEVYEPKTLKGKMQITTASRYAYILAVDLINEEIIWLNIGKKSYSNIAYSCDAHFLRKYFTRASILSLQDLFKMMALKETSNINEADVILSDNIDSPKTIHSYDIEKMLSYLKC